MRVLSLFSGIGGIDLAAQWAGMETVAFCEIDKFCQKILSRHWPGVPIFDDVTKLSAESLSRAGVDPESIHMVVGGFPCQDISAAGKGEGIEGARSGLWFEMLRVVRDVRPRYVLCENVPALRTRGADAVLAGLEEAGYAAGTFVVGAWAVGAPHRRNRAFIVAHSGGSAGNTGSDRSGREARAELGDANGTGREAFGPCSVGYGAGSFGRRGSEELVNADSTGRRELRGAESVRAEQPAVECAGAFNGAVADADGSERRPPFGWRPHDDDGAHARREEASSRFELRRSRWPARPGEQQHEWEAPRVVGNSESDILGEDAASTGGGESAGAGEACGGVVRKGMRRAVNGRFAGTSGRQVESGMGHAVDGLSRRMAGNRVAKLKALGNAVVPQQVYPILKAIMDYEQQREVA